MAESPRASGLSCWPFAICAAQCFCAIAKGLKVRCGSDGRRRRHLAVHYSRRTVGLLERTTLEAPCGAQSPTLGLENNPSRILFKLNIKVPPCLTLIQSVNKFVLLCLLLAICNKQLNLLQRRQNQGTFLSHSIHIGVQEPENNPWSEILSGLHAFPSLLLLLLLPLKHGQLPARRVFITASAGARL